MESSDSGKWEPLPWDHGDFFSEEGFEKANDYFLKTHGKYSRIILEARQAQGFSKAALRWKLNREIGEDFRMYTGLKIGDKAPADVKQPLGIQGELNHLLASSRKKVAPARPVESRIQEDLAIVSHPLGPLEVCYSLCHFYKELTKRYASFGAGRREMLKGAVDEEIFKWIWRLYYGSVLMPPEAATDYYDHIPSTGLAYIPLEQQRISSPEKTIAIAQFLLGEHVAASHLRKPLCFYFVEFLRATQYRLLPKAQRSRLEKAFEEANKRKEEDGVDDMLVAIDANMNAKGGSNDSFEDLFKDEEEEVFELVAPQEQGFILNHLEFTRANFARSLSKFLPLATDGANSAQEQISLMPIVLVLRTMPSAGAEEILSKIPGPFLNLIVNRLRFSGADTVSGNLLHRTEKMIETRREAGERYVIPTTGKAGVVASSVRVQGAGQQGAGDGAAKEEAENEAPAPQAARPSAPQGAGAAPPVQDGAGVGAPDASGAAPGEAESPPARQAARGEPDASGAGEPDEPARVIYRGVAELGLIIGWQVSDGGLSMQTLSPRQICSYTGFDQYCLMPWVVFALQTGQIAKGEVAKISRQTVNELLQSVSDELDSESPGQLPEQELDQLRAQSGQMPAHQFLRTLHDLVETGAAHPPASKLIAEGVRKLTARLGANLEGFLRNPGQASHRPLVQDLSREERYIATVLSRVAKLTGPPPSG